MSDEIIINVDVSADAETRLVISDRALLISCDLYAISSAFAVASGKQAETTKLLGRPER